VVIIYKTVMNQTRLLYIIYEIKREAFKSIVKYYRRTIVLFLLQGFC